MRSNQRAITLLLAMGLCLIPSSALTGANPVPVHKFLDGRNIMMQGISAILIAADIATTNRALQVPGTRELNPLGQSPAARYALKFAGFGAGLGLAYGMHKTGHHKAERIVPLLFAVPSGVMAAHNAGIHR